MDSQANAVKSESKVLIVKVFQVFQVFQHINYINTRSVISSNMSQIIHTSDKNKNHKRATIANVFSSTPIKLSPIKHYSISLSEIDTGSSSSGGTRDLTSLIRGEDNYYVLIIILL